MQIKEQMEPYITKHYTGDESSYSPSGFKLRTPKSKDGFRVSEKNYWRYYYDHPDFNYEWNNGLLEEKAVSNLRGFNIFRWFFALIEQYLKTTREGILVGLEMGFKLDLKTKKTIRKPDLALIHKDNPIQMAPEDRTYVGCFDMCFEALSDSTTKAKENDTVVKKSEYGNFGVKEYFIFDEKDKETAFYKLNKKGIYTKIRPQRGGIIKSSVLKDFQFRKKDLYLQPDLEELTKDPIYKHYVLKNFQDEVQTVLKNFQTENLKSEKKGSLKGKISALEDMYKMNYLPKEKFEEMVNPLREELKKLMS